MQKTGYRMLSLDTSSTKCGWALRESGILVKSNEIDKSKIKDGETRLNVMCMAIVDLLEKYKPGTVVCEMVVVERNAHTQRLLSEIVGCVRGWTITRDQEFVEYRPPVWRSLVCDEGEKAPRKRDDCKIWAVNKVKQKYNLDVGDNEAEAILIGEARLREFNINIIYNKAS